jgi:hypothetical protein
MFRKRCIPRRIQAVPARLIIGIVATASVSLCGLLSTFLSDKMVDQVNKKLPMDLQFSPLGWHPAKTLRLHREYQKLYPGGQLVLQVRLLIVSAFTSLLLCAWALGFFGK